MATKTPAAPKPRSVATATDVDGDQVLVQLMGSEVFVQVRMSDGSFCTAHISKAQWADISSLGNQA